MKPCKRRRAGLFVAANGFKWKLLPYCLRWGPQKSARLSFIKVYASGFVQFETTGKRILIYDKCGGKGWGKGGGDIGCNVAVCTNGGGSLAGGCVSSVWNFFTLYLERTDWNRCCEPFEPSCRMLTRDQFETMAHFCEEQIAPLVAFIFQMGTTVKNK